MREIEGMGEKKRGGLRQIVFEIAFPQSARPTLRYISPEFGYRSPLWPLIRVKTPTNCDEHFAESLFQTGSKVYLCKRIRRKWVV